MSISRVFELVCDCREPDCPHHLVEQPDPVKCGCAVTDYAPNTTAMRFLEKERGWDRNRTPAGGMDLLDLCPRCATYRREFLVTRRRTKAI